jgi:hypothetical protein
MSVHSASLYTHLVTVYVSFSTDLWRQQLHSFNSDRGHRHRAEAYVYFSKRYVRDRMVVYRFIFFWFALSFMFGPVPRKPR